MKRLTNNKTAIGIITLTRWKEYVPFVLPLTLIGSLLATQSRGLPLDSRVLSITLANTLVVAYAFMINDIEDARDDARDPKRAVKNALASGLLKEHTAYLACQLTAIAALVLYLTGGLFVLVLGAVTLLLSHFYSSKPIRLKAWPVTDIVSHSLMLSTLLALTGFYTYSTNPGAAWWLFACVTFLSAYGQLYNQLRDYKMDKLAKLKNTAILLGQKNAKVLMYTALAFCIFSFIGAVLSGLFPVWLIIVVALILPASKVFRGKVDMSGKAYFEKSGELQMQLLVVANIVVAIWISQVVFSQVFLK